MLYRDLFNAVKDELDKTRIDRAKNILMEKLLEIEELSYLLQESKKELEELLNREV